MNKANFIRNLKKKAKEIRLSIEEEEKLKAYYLKFLNEQNDIIKKTLKNKKKMKKLLTSKEVDALIIKHQKLKYQEITDEINKVSKKRYSWYAVRSRYRKMKLPQKERGIFSNYSPEEELQKHRDKIHQQDEKKVNEKKFKLLIEENERLKKELDALLEMKSGINPVFIEKKVGSNNSEAVAVILASDFHLEETVKPETVNGLNKFNLQIAEERSKQFFQNTLKLLIKEQQNAKIDTIVLALLGDFISGNIHEELLENCSLRPIEAIIFAENILIGGIEFLLNNSDVKIIIPCHVGNHTRITKKIHISTEGGNSLETFMYYHIKNYFKGNPRVEFFISEGYLSYLTVYNFTIRFHHGHAVKYGGGVGGLTIPVNKAIAQWQKLKHADLDCFGHFHQFFDGGNFICNGSLIGYNSFAVMIKGSYERPKQAFFLIDRVRGKTVVCPITFDK